MITPSEERDRERWGEERDRERQRETERNPVKTQTKEKKKKKVSCTTPIPPSSLLVPTAPTKKDGGREKQKKADTQSGAVRRG